MLIQKERKKNRKKYVKESEWNKISFYLFERK